MSRTAPLLRGRPAVPGGGIMAPPAADINPLMNAFCNPGALDGRRPGVDPGNAAPAAGAPPTLDPCGPV